MTKPCLRRNDEPCLPGNEDGLTLRIAIANQWGLIYFKSSSNRLIEIVFAKDKIYPQHNTIKLKRINPYAKVCTDGILL
ncbi:MAG TPA: hypothetical protein VKI61_01535 [Chitinophagaceae bacterium]|nr:hypothetical protein [Chitinophagaceae bacterium]